MAAHSPAEPRIALAFGRTLAVNRVVVVAVVLAAAVAIAVRVPFFNWPLITDEGGYAYIAYWWFHGFILYSEDLWLDRPQGIFLVYQLGLQLLGDTAWSIRLWGAIWAACTAGIVLLVTKRLFNDRAAIAAALLFALFSAAPHIEGFTANAETFMVAPLSLSAYFLLARKPVCAGALASVAFLLKPSGASAFLLAGLWLLYVRANWREWERLFLASLALPLLAAAHAAMTVGLERYAYSIAIYRLGLGWRPSDQPGWLALVNWVKTSPVWAPLAVLSLPAFRGQPRGNMVFVFLWLFSSVCGTALGGQWFWHYFIQLIPPLSVLAGAGLASLWTSRISWVRWEGIVLALLVFALCEGPFFLAGSTEGSKTLYHRLGYQVSDEVADYLKSHTRQGDTIYVAFSEAEVYHLCQRRSASPYLFRVHLLDFPGAYEDAVDAIQARRPLYVLALDPPIQQIDPENRFWRILESGYEVEMTFEGVPLYRRRG